LQVCTEMHLKQLPLSACIKPLIFVDFVLSRVSHFFVQIVVSGGFLFVLFSTFFNCYKCVVIYIQSILIFCRSNFLVSLKVIYGSDNEATKWIIITIVFQFHYVTFIKFALLAIVFFVNAPFCSCVGIFYNMHHKEQLKFFVSGRIEILSFWNPAWNVKQ